MVQHVSSVVNTALHRIQQQYTELINANQSISLLSLFNSGNFDFDLYCSDYTPHPAIAELKKSTTSFGEKYGILLPDADAYITCAMFLFPAAPLEKIIILSKNYAVDFYLNDKMGRDARPTNQEMKILYEIRDRLSSIGNDLKLQPKASLAEIANIEVLQQIADSSPKDWFDHFIRLYLDHINIAHQAYDLVTLGHLQSIEEYIYMRADISGMPHTVSLIEYANSAFLDWDLLHRIGLAEDIRNLNETVSYIGALTNDLFSFEKEVIDNGSSSNLIVIVWVNNFRMRLDDAIEVAGHIIRNLLADYNETITAVNDRLNQCTISEMSKIEISRYLSGLKSVLQACWRWQTYTSRYKRPLSLWQETQTRETVAK
ncbi:terpene synthase family protein [Chitinophaga tropicalis]|uniref:Terpene synthase n=1 Tax=Chitinophaga tropicalis TaxID=2683588 RepID=A0A7K1U021_9BACT|nr:terpene synthase family protein [Chitinophaga tropicalis]MVT07708.1 hypothetical protein [Chitinophaga tropicalis]